MADPSNRFPSRQKRLAWLYLEIITKTCHLHIWLHIIPAIRLNPRHSCWSPFFSRLNLSISNHPGSKTNKSGPFSRVYAPNEFKRPSVCLVASKALWPWRSRTSSPNSTIRAWPNLKRCSLLYQVLYHPLDSYSQVHFILFVFCKKNKRKINTFCYCVKRFYVEPLNFVQKWSALYIIFSKIWIA